MVKIYLCGPGGAGKTTIAKEMLKMKQYSAYKHIEEVARNVMKKQQIDGTSLRQFSTDKFRKLQKDILLAQCEAEINIERECCGFISDRSILDCLAYAVWKCSENEDIESELSKFQLNEIIKNAIKRYQTSLFVIVYPWSDQKSKDDGTRYPMDKSDAIIFIDILKRLLHYFKISFLNLTESDRKERINIIHDSIKYGKIKRESYTLPFYQEMSSKPRKGTSNTSTSVKKKSDYGNVIVSFYLPYNNKHDIRSVSISEDSIQLSKHSMGNKKGRIFSEINAHNIVSIKFDKKIPADQVRTMLSRDIFVEGEQYTFLGCSSGGLKNRNAFLIKGDKKKAENTLLKFGKFNEIKSVSKKMARIGLLFSSVLVTDVKINPKNIIQVADIERGKYNFTDGCGGIGKHLAALIYHSLPKYEKVQSLPNYIPSVYQFRLHGCKGVVAVDPQIAPSKILVRPSMIKFHTDKLPFFSVCDISRPYKYGHLNKQLIYLLSSRQVPDFVFFELQEELYDLFSNMFKDREAAITIFHWYEKYEEANLLLQNTAPFMENPFLRKALRTIEQEYVSKSKTVKGETKEKLRIIVKKSRLLYGVADQTNLLKYGTCYLCITINGVPKVITGKILSGRMPCYLKGDIRILEAVDVPELNHLVDCVVFPTSGKQPHADEQAGGDLDGDKFFVTWDDRLIPPTKVPSPCYPPADNVLEKEPNIDAMIKYFSLQNNSMKMIGLLNNLFESWADLKGADCEECQWIGQFFGRAIDSIKTGEKLRVPTCFLNPPTKLDGEENNFVWKNLEKNALKYKEKRNKEIVQNAVVKDDFMADVSFDYVESTLQDEFSSLPEYEKFIFAWKFSLMVCQQNISDRLSFMKDHFLEHINFSLFSATEKIEAIDVGIPASVVMNGLLKSQVLTEGDLSHYKSIDTKSNWGIIYKSSYSDLEFKDFINRIIYHDCVLIMFQLPDNVSVGVKIIQSLHKDKVQNLPVGSLTSFFISKGFGYFKLYEPKEDLFYDLNDDRFQIYRRLNVANSFLSLSSQKFKQSSKGLEMFVLVSNELQEILSVDLTSYDGNIIRMSGGRRPHPLVRKTPVLSIEVFAVDKDALSYPDLLIANQIEVDEIFEDEIDILVDQNDDRDLCKVLFEELTAVNNRKLSLDGVKDTLKHLIAIVTPFNCEVSSEITKEIEKLLDNVNMSSLSWQDGFEILSCLSKIGCISIGMEFISNISTEITMEQFLNILSDWRLMWYLDPVDFITCLQELKTMLLSRDDLAPKARYVIQVVWSSVIEFLDDMVTSKGTWKRNCISHLRLLNNQGVNINETSEEAEEEIEENKDIFVNVFRSAPLEKELVLPSLGDYVLLLQVKHFRRSENIVQSISCIGSVCSVTKFPISMQLKLLDEEMPDIFQNNCDSNWIAVLLPGVNIALYNRIIKASQILFSESSPVLDFACGVLNPETPRLLHPSMQINLSDGKEFNAAQIKAISASFSFPITCIQGPPGCGKTKCACAILKLAVKMYEGKEILAVAETNTAVDNMTRKLQESGVKVLRIAGDLRKISPDLLDTTIEGKLRILAEKEGKKVDFRTASGETRLKKNLKKKVLEDAEVILTTCAGAGEVFLLDRKFRFVLVDEATQTKQATLLCALAHKAEQLVLIGDPLQLGPLVKLQKPSPWISDTLLEEASFELLNSLFHRIHQANPEATYLLNIQYRMHPKIAQFSSDNFYEGRVQSGTTVENRKPLWPLGSEPVGFFHVDGEEKRHGTSYANTQEQLKIKNVISEMLKSPNINKENITVLALYNGQVHSLRNLLCDIVVNSIDGFQGKENEYILVSTVRSNFNLGHTSDEKRLNVLLTRAKRGLLVFGHSPTLMTSDLWRKWIDSVPRFNI